MSTRPLFRSYAATMAIIAPKFELEVYLKRDLVCKDTEHVSQAFATALGVDMGIVDSEVQLITVSVQGEANCQKLDASTVNILRQRVVYETYCMGTAIPTAGLRNLVRALQKTNKDCLEDLAGTFCSISDVNTLQWTKVPHQVNSISNGDPLLELGEAMAIVTLSKALTQRREAAKLSSTGRRPARPYDVASQLTAQGYGEVPRETAPRSSWWRPSWWRPRTRPRGFPSSTRS
jgi:hypothetical protein